jgi:hypothetical protein
MSHTILLQLVLWHNRQTVACLVLRPNQETVVVILSLKSPNRTYRFWGPNWVTVDLGFQAKPRNPRSLSPCAWCKSHTTSHDLPIVWPPSTRPVLDHPRSSARSLLHLPRSSSLTALSHLSPTHHERSKRDSLHKIDSSWTSEMSQIRIQTMAC